MLLTEIDAVPATTEARAPGDGFPRATAVLPAQAIATGTEGLVAGAVTVPVGGFELPAYRAMPAAGAGFPIVVVVSEIFGVHEYIADVARRLAHLGYLAIAPELFVRQGDAKSIADTATLFAQIISKVPDAQVMDDLDATVRWAAQNGGDEARLGITGFCWGGRITWLYAAHSAKVRAAVAWYGKLTGPKTALQPAHPLDVAARLQAPVLGLYGGADAGIGLDTVEQMKAALAAGNAAARASRFVVYPQAQHAFHADYRPNYDAAAAADGWQRCVEWLRTHGVA